MKVTTQASLRQFARTIFADRLIGDEFVNAAIAEIERGGGAISGKPVEAFRALVSKWRAVSASTEPVRPFSNEALLAASGPPPPTTRLVLILVDVLGFTPAQAETILAPLDAPVADVLSAGRLETARLSGGAALIIEDEPLLAADLSDLVEEMGVSVIGIARSAQQGVALALKHHPDVVLADYNLVGQATGLDAVEEIQEAMDCPAIFITGFPEKVLTGESIEPDFVIAKPYTPQAVRAAVAQSLLTERSEVIE